MNNSVKFPLLLEPGYIGSVKTRNRMIKTAAGTFFASTDENYPMTDKIRWHYEAMARGGVGLLVVESPIIDYPIGARRKNRLRVDDDKYIDNLRELTDIIHKQNCPTFMQMNHDGPWQMAGFSQDSGDTPVAASPVSFKSETDLHNEIPRELTIPEIEEIIEKFVNAAIRAQKAGFDGVDINAGSSHLMHNFLSPFWNRRQDNYGGNLENRTRFIVSIIKQIKKRLGNNFPVSVCLNGVEIGKLIGVEDDKCSTSEDVKHIAVILQDAGADALMVRSLWLGKHISCFLPDTLFYPDLPDCASSYKHLFDLSRWGVGGQVPLAQGIKEAVSIPVIAVGRLDAALGERILRSGKADFIGMTRRLIADPEYPNKVGEGRLEDIAVCTACYTCLEEKRRCRINAAHGSDEQYLIKPAEKKKRVIVVGGGPAGMEAARVSALRGHEVILYEKSRKLGGLVPLASIMRELEIQDIMVLVKYLETQVAKLGVTVKLGQEFDSSLIQKGDADVVFLAVGGKNEPPDIPGIEKPIVVNSAHLHNQLKFYLKFMKPDTLRRLTRYWMPLGKRVIIIGAGRQGLELAMFLFKRGRKVTIVDTVEAFSGVKKTHLNKLLLVWFREKNVTMFTNVQHMEVIDSGLTIITKEGEQYTIEADNIIPALPLKPNTVLLRSLEEKVPEVYTVGDCSEAGLIVDAIGSSWQIARKS